MHFPRFWRAAKSGSVTTWGWSNRSAEDALTLARQRQEQVFAAIKAGRTRELRTYGYPDRPLCEEVLREFSTDENGTPRAVITRNAYGALVLNTSELLIVAVDAPEERSSGILAGWFGRTRVDPQRALEERLLARAEQWTAELPAWRWRIYRTAAGARLLATHAAVAPNEPDALRAFEAFGADERYCALCRNQRCFRARLTPKPWRCDIAKPPGRWPWDDSAEEQAFREWEKTYLSASLQYASCRLIAEVGSAPASTDLAELLAVHDQGTQATSELPLA